ncbi:hypothetical protein OROGR_000055 [Orobanche gracilis]
MQQVDQVKEMLVPVNMGEVNFSQAEDIRLETTRARFSSVLKRHGELTEKLSRKVLIFLGTLTRLSLNDCKENLKLNMLLKHKEICLDGEQWNDGLLATIRERVHMEVERKATQSQDDAAAVPSLLSLEKITYRVGNKIIDDGYHGVTDLLGLMGDLLIYFVPKKWITMIGEPCEVFHCVLESKSFLEKMIVLEHSIPFFLPIRDVENDYLSSNVMKFIDYVGDLLQAYVDRREQVRLIKELYGNQIGELYCSLPFHMVEFVLTNFEW